MREKDIKKFTQSNVKIKFYPFSDYKKYLPAMYSEILGLATLQREKLDVLHSTSQFSRIPSGYRGKTVTTFNDLISFCAPQYLPSAKKIRDKALTKFMAKKTVITSYSIHYTKLYERYLASEKNGLKSSFQIKIDYEPSTGSDFLSGSRCFFAGLKCWQ